MWLDAAWRQGVFHELDVWRQLMPAAYASGHLPNPVTPDVGQIFNGNSILFLGYECIRTPKLRSPISGAPIKAGANRRVNRR